jgi:hypothetical protein
MELAFGRRLGSLKGGGLLLSGVLVRKWIWVGIGHRRETRCQQQSVFDCSILGKDEKRRLLIWRSFTNFPALLKISFATGTVSHAAEFRDKQNYYLEASHLS